MNADREPQGQEGQESDGRSLHASLYLNEPEMLFLFPLRLQVYKMMFFFIRIEGLLNDLNTCASEQKLTQEEKNVEDEKKAEAQALLQHIEVCDVLSSCNTSRLLTFSFNLITQQKMSTSRGALDEFFSLYPRFKKRVRWPFQTEASRGGQGGRTGRGRGRGRGRGGRRGRGRGGRRRRDEDTEEDDAEASQGGDTSADEDHGDEDLVDDDGDELGEDDE